MIIQTTKSKFGQWTRTFGLIKVASYCIDNLDGATHKEWISTVFSYINKTNLLRTSFLPAVLRTSFLPVFNSINKTNLLRASFLPGVDEIKIYIKK